MASATASESSSSSPHPSALHSCSPCPARAALRTGTADGSFFDLGAFDDEGEGWAPKCAVSSVVRARTTAVVSCAC
jgi:hypothetical protein